MAKAKSWEVTDDFWKRVEPLAPSRERLTEKGHVRKTGGGRKPKNTRLVFEGIVYVPGTGCQRKAMPDRFGSASAIHTRFLQWEKAGSSGSRGRLACPNMMTWKGLPGAGRA